LQATFPPGEAREDWKIIRAFAESYGIALPFDSLLHLRELMIEHAPVLGNIGAREQAPWSAFGKHGNLTAQPFVPVIENFYMTDPISRASVTMAKCTSEILPLIMPEAAE
jgi:NADH-quinone oxidoreductase subunit G